MSCASHELRDAGPLVQLILRIPTILWSVQAALGIPDEIGLFSPPDLPLCQLVELTVLTVVHGLRIFLYPSFKCNWIKGKKPGSVERNRYWIASAGFTVYMWLELMVVSLLHHAPPPRNKYTLLMLIYQVRYLESRACLQDSGIEQCSQNNR